MRASVAALLMTGGCMSPVEGGPAGKEPVPVHGSTPGYKCDAAKGQTLVGEAATADLGARAIQLTSARTLRWIRPGDAVTMDFREDRLNLELDAANRVAAVRCG